MEIFNYKEHKNRDFIDQAVADGWVASVGPWGYSEYEHTVSLKKDMPELGGYFTLWIEDRNLGVSTFDQVTSRWVSVYPETHWCQSIQGWFKKAENDSHALKLTSQYVKFAWDQYDMQVFINAATECDECSKHFHPDDLFHAAFANAACATCISGLRQNLEVPGWVL